MSKAKPEVSHVREMRGRRPRGISTGSVGVVRAALAWFGRSISVGANLGAAIRIPGFALGRLVVQRGFAGEGVVPAERLAF